MNIIFSDKANGFKPNIFNILEEKRQERLKAGKSVINFSVGTPDFTPDREVMEVVSKAALNPDNYKYSLSDTPEMLSAVQRWYKRRFNVDLEHNEIMSVNGTQEGIAHIALTLCNEGDTALVSNPSYPIFQIGPYLNGAKIEYYPIRKENCFIPNLSEIPNEIAERAKMMLVSYPANPVCATASRDFYENLVEFAKKHNIVIIHDNAYSEIVFGGKRGFSFLEVDGAKEVGIEFNSLSKTYNLTGLRISYALGNAEIIKRFKTIRSQFDYGMSHIAQLAAIKALDGSQESVLNNRTEYERRMKALCEGFRSIGWNVSDSMGTMFVWAEIPDGFESSEKFVMTLFEKTGVLCTPGISFGSLGEGFVRFALVHPVEKIREAVNLVKESGLIRQTVTI